MTDELLSFIKILLHDFVYLSYIILGLRHRASACDTVSALCTYLPSSLWKDNNNNTIIIVIVVVIVIAVIIVFVIIIIISLLLL